jgi:hypothetical protein
MESFRGLPYPRPAPRAVAADRETGEVDSDEVGGNHQAVAVGVEGADEIVDEFIADAPGTGPLIRHRPLNLPSLARKG